VPVKPGQAAKQPGRLDGLAGLAEMAGLGCGQAGLRQMERMEARKKIK